MTLALNSPVQDAGAAIDSVNNIAFTMEEGLRTGSRISAAPCILVRGKSPNRTKATRRQERWSHLLFGCPLNGAH